ncbi:MAG: clostripain-related cysteine peptidase [Pseudomonadota bacterium]
MRALVPLALALCLGACKKHDDSGPDDTGEPAPEVGRWTIMVWMDGDNDLESFVSHDLNELELAGSGDGVEIVVQADRAIGYSDNGGDWTDTRRYHIVEDDDPASLASELLEEVGEADMGDPEALSEFLLWADTRYPAERVALVFWDHGTGWMLGEPVPGVAWDEESGHELTFADGAVQAGLQPLEDARGGPIDVIAFDACNMAAWEVAHVLEDHALAMAASEATVGMSGLQYNLTFASLREQPAWGPAELAADLARQAVEDGGEWTFSATDLTLVRPLSEAVDALALAVLDDESLVQPLLDARGASQGTDPHYPLWYMDLGSLGEALVASPAPVLAARGQDLLDALDGAVIGAWGSGPYGWSSGLNILFDARWADHLQDYSQGSGATWAQDTHWDDLLLLLSER